MMGVRRFLGISSIFTIDPEVLGFFCETSSPHPMEIRPEQLTGLKIGRALFVGVHRLVGSKSMGSAVSPERSSLLPRTLCRILLTIFDMLQCQHSP
jgi:hypothetical protein